MSPEQAEMSALGVDTRSDMGLIPNRGTASS